MDDLVYKPDMDVVRSARYFIKALCEKYGHTKGMEVWDRIREVLGDQAAGDIFLGMLTQQYSQVTVSKIGSYKIDAIKLVREITDYGLKDAKDFVEDISDRGMTLTLDLSGKDEAFVERWLRDMRRIGCVVG
jgi:ribosomal protein L7/L12